MSHTTASRNASRRSSAPTPPVSMCPRCPRFGCQTPLQAQPGRLHDPMTGLESVRCPDCGHEGYIARHGVRMLFSDRRESVFTYGPSLSTLTVILSSTAQTQFAPFQWPFAQLATRVAEWALVTGCVAGTIEAYPDSAVFADCYEYYRSHHESADPAA